MNLQSFSRMPFSSDAAWPELAILDAMVAKVFFALVVPFSLIPAAMIYYAGVQYGDPFSTSIWNTVAFIFFLAEISSVSLMGWLIKRAAEAHDGHIGYRNSYLLAAIAPIPLWLSSLGLFVPSMAFNGIVSLVALCLSCGLIYHGIRSFSDIDDKHTAAVTRTVFGSGLVAWAILLTALIFFAGMAGIPSIALVGM